MGILEVLTLVFVVLKLVGVIAWSWWIVLSPVLLAVAIYIIWIIILIGVAISGGKRVYKKRR